ncbi:hypothetical protein PED39_02445 [Methanomassiliicoccales archaeon LGM-RCC1]|nr:hypothetical protein PED39_02445 [Methanomassiliicoccales archaeon LGM-RCC1]
MAYKGKHPCSKETVERITSVRVDDVNLERIASICKLRALIQLKEGPRYLMDLYGLVNLQNKTKLRFDEMEALGLIFYSTLNRKTVVELTEKGERVATHLRAILGELEPLN